jgi:hypothetical protein
MKMLQEIGSNYSSSIVADKSWLRKEWASGRRICPECNSLRREIYPAPFEIYLDYIPEEFWSCNFVVGTGVMIYRKDLIEVLQPHLADYVCGPCYYKGKPSDYVTCYSQKKLLLRSDKDARYFSCGTCGNISVQYGDGPEYYVRSTLTDAKVYQDDLCHFLIEEELALNIDWNRWPELFLIPGDIWDKPIDDLTDNPADWPPQIPLRLWYDYVMMRVRNAK